jgi:hypothetical protein
MLLSTLLFASVTLLTQCSGSASSAETKTLTFDRQSLTVRPDRLIVGVGLHFGLGADFGYDPGKSAARLKELGVDSYRDDLPWMAFADSDFSRHTYYPQPLFHFLEMAGLRPLIILNFPRKPGEPPPLDDAARAAFADFAAQAARVTARFNPIYEIWNEWNMNARPVTSPKDWLVGPGEANDPRAAVNYAALAKPTVTALSAASPQSPVLAGAVGVDRDWLWTKAIVQQGATRGGAGLSVHLYNHCEADPDDRTASQAIGQLDALRDTLDKLGTAAETSVYVTEFGWPTTASGCAVSKQAAADNIAQFLLWSAATSWIKGAWIYELKDQGHNANELEDNFGLYTYDYTPKPAACAVANVMRMIKASRAYRRERPFPNVFLVQLATEKGVRVVAWTRSANFAASISSPGGHVLHASRLCSGPVEAGPAVTIGPEPVIFDMPDADSIILTVKTAP